MKDSEPNKFQKQKQGVFINLDLTNFFGKKPHHFIFMQLKPAQTNLKYANVEFSGKKVKTRRDIDIEYYSSWILSCQGCSLLITINSSMIQLFSPTPAQ